jgi:UDP-N-acetyl-D-mannosaminuronate dehydrogenase
VDVPVERRLLRVANCIAYSRRRYDKLKSIDLTAANVEAADCVLILTKDRAVDFTTIAEHADMIVDTRNALSKEMRVASRAHVVRL